VRPETSTIGRARGIREVLREALRVDRRRGDDDLQVGTLGEDPREVAEQEVDVQRSLVRLVDDDRVVAAQQPVAVDLVEQDAVGDERDLRVRRHLVGEAHLVADRAAERHLELVRDALGDRPRGDAARLRVGDGGAAELEADLRQLRRLARPGRTRDDDDLMPRDRARDLVPRGADGQLRRVGDHGFREGIALHRMRSPLASAARAPPLDPALHPVVQAVELVRHLHRRPERVPEDREQDGYRRENDDDPLSRRAPETTVDAAPATCCSAKVSASNRNGQIAIV
jgi:hypothetical protein